MPRIGQRMGGDNFEQKGAVIRLFRFNSGLRIAQGKAEIAIMEECNHKIKAWLESKERARIEVSETSTISPKRIDAQKIFLYSRYAGPLPKTFEVHRDASIATLKDLLRYFKVERRKISILRPRPIAEHFLTDFVR